MDSARRGGDAAVSHASAGSGLTASRSGPRRARPPDDCRTGDDGPAQRRLSPTACRPVLLPGIPPIRATNKYHAARIAAPLRPRLRREPRVPPGATELTLLSSAFYSYEKSFTCRRAPAGRRGRRQRRVRGEALRRRGAAGRSRLAPGCQTRRRNQPGQVESGPGSRVERHCPTAAGSWLERSTRSRTERQSRSCGTGIRGRCPQSSGRSSRRTCSRRRGRRWASPPG